MVAKQLRNSIARGEDPTVTIGHIAKSTPANDDTFGVWTVRYAKMLSRQFPSGHPTLEEQLQTLENLPEPPSFHR